VRFVAADWSGAARGEQRHLWMADADRGGLICLGGCTRSQAGQRLLDLADADPELVVGLDFGFSLPSWFLDREGIESAPDLWRDGRRLERWLAECPFPFWGRPGRRRPPLAPEQHWRRTELASTPRPRSMFQIGGSGAVGTASLRGMPVLHRLRQAGFAIWPFDRPGRPMAMEVWPRLAIGSVVKSRRPSRRLWLEQHLRSTAIEAGALAAAEASEDAFDATAAVLALARQFHTDPPAASDPTVVREGWIWGVPLPRAGVGPPSAEAIVGAGRRSPSGTMKS
jgi:hypothetical protein